MDDWFSVISANSELPANAVQQLHDIGFIVIPVPSLQRNFRSSPRPTMQRSWPRIPMMLGLGAHRRG